MCGITGYVSFSEKKINAGIISKSTDLIRHRGPNDEGFVIFHENDKTPIICSGSDTPNNVYSTETPYTPKKNISEYIETPIYTALAHRRLSIVDLSPLGHQPMSYANNRFWIIYNGEVYNHLELRSELEEIGHHFISHTDTEVIIAAYVQWGEDCLSRLNGMFALAIYDSLQSTLFLARDRFGIKPLYYWIPSDDELVFASEIKQFTVFPEWNPKVNGQRAYDFLAFGISDHTDETMFSGVYQLPPGHYATLHKVNNKNHLKQESKIKSTQWYTLNPAPFTGSYTEACQQFEEIFEDAVRLRLRADVPIGSCLSGGLDSSSIVCVMNRLLREKNAPYLQKTFSACAEIARFDERKWIDIVVAETEVQGHYVYPPLDELFSTTPTITWHQDEPFGSTSIYAQWSVFQAAKEQNVTVMLDGQGSDEHLAGYHNFFGPYLASLLKQLNWLDLLSEIHAMKRQHGYSYMRSAKYLAASIFPEKIKNALKRQAGYEHNTPDWLDLTCLNAIPLNPMIRTGSAKAGTVRELSIAQLTASNVQMLLHWEDRDSMAHSIESRVPFLDYRLVEFSVSLPDKYKISKGITKKILRDSMTNKIPNAIKNRIDKLGFVTPEEIWLKEHAPEKFREELNNAIIASQGIIKPIEAKKLLDNIIDGHKKFSFLPWRIISFGKWMEVFKISPNTNPIKNK